MHVISKQNWVLKDCSFIEGISRVKYSINEDNLLFRVRAENYYQVELKISYYSLYIQIKCFVISIGNQFPGMHCYL